MTGKTVWLAVAARHRSGAGIVRERFVQWRGFPEHPFSRCRPDQRAGPAPDLGTRRPAADHGSNPTSPPRAR
jgi:hypothetical protein